MIISKQFAKFSIKIFVVGYHYALVICNHAPTPPEGGAGVELCFYFFIVPEVPGKLNTGQSRSNVLVGGWVHRSHTRYK